EPELNLSVKVYVRLIRFALVVAITRHLIKCKLAPYNFSEVTGWCESVVPASKSHVEIPCFMEKGECCAVKVVLQPFPRSEITGFDQTVADDQVGKAQ